MKKRIVAMLLTVVIVLSTMIQGLPADAASKCNHWLYYEYENLGNGTHRKYCTKSGCGYSTTENHNLSKKPAKDASCENAGNIAHYACSKCDALYATNNTSQPLTQSDVTIKALGHNYEWVNLAVGHVKKCTRSGCLSTDGSHTATHTDYVDNKDGLTHSKGCH